jgi:sulfide:quinone oxidoreductase
MTRRPLRVLIAGGGVAGVEAALRLHALAGDRVRIELLSPRADLVDRPLQVREPFDGTFAPRLPLARLDARDIRVREDALESVEAARGRVLTRSCARVGYDRLLVATGAPLTVAVPGALAFGGPTGGGRFERVMRRLRDAGAGRLALVVPPGPGWSLPLYELALLAAPRLPGVEVLVVTPEARPLATFGAAAADAVADVLAAAGVRVRTGAVATAAVDGALELSDGTREPADAVVAGPAVTGPWLHGLPADMDGFVVVDRPGAVPGCPGVDAAGDVTAGPIKQGGLAAQQADAAATAIAAAAGAPVPPAPEACTLRAVLLTGGEPLYLRAELVQGRPRNSVASREPLWWPPVKLAAHHLASFLVSGGESHEPLVDRAR